MGKPEAGMERTRIIGYLAPDQPAAKSDLKTGDEILEINGNPIKQFFGFKESVVSTIAFSTSDNINVKVLRNGQPLSIDIHAPLVGNKEWTEYEAKNWWGKLTSRPPMRKIGIGPLSKMHVDEVIEFSPAALAGIKKGDVITAINGVATLNAHAELLDLAKKAPADEAKLTIQRDGNSLIIPITAAYPEKPDKSKLEMPLTGIGFKPETDWVMSMKGDNPIGICWDFLTNTFVTLRALFQKDSAISPGLMSGPVGIVNVYYNLFHHPYWGHMIIWFSVMLNCGLAFFNLLPIPVLDGGHITMALYEMIRKKAIPLKLLEYATSLCVFALLGFMIFVTMKDVKGAFENGDGEKIIYADPAKKPADAAVPAAPAPTPSPAN